MDRDREDLRISEMLKFSKTLWEKNKDNWSPMEPKYGKSFILYMIEEIGEVISIIKKKGEDEIMDNNEVREKFIEEMGDVLMYYMDVLNRFNITSEEFSKIYLNKYISNMDRNYEKQYKDFITNK
ncbi:MULTISPECIES: MazG nucleotide pyrophosphohydrolase domain-containing protein [unclassified Clostridium]|uniref:MazG nucleotide pyrophosphohydrolase domain-containing protein n=1 Tax=unclassified Clostridium TaxID=2614128 RepID=UPI0025BDA9B5|nr:MULTISPECIES: MazG nucleotide pyrophosphohydrolase domain-containing protein [unclassified Clostridium]